MGFNKRFVNKDTIRGIYENSGISGLCEHISKPDVLMVGDDMDDVFEILSQCSCETVKKLKLEGMLYG